MTIKNQQLSFGKLAGNDEIPYELLYLADPSANLVESYLKVSDLYVAKKEQEIIGVIVLFSVSSETVEIKNVAIKPAFQRQGIGQYMLEKAIEIVATNKFKNIQIGTANSSVGQLHLYQKLGFEMSEIKKNFFIEKYTEPIFENGIQAKHMILLKRRL